MGSDSEMDNKGGSGRAVPELLGLVVWQVGEAGVVDVEDPGVEAVGVRVLVGGDLVDVVGRLLHDAGEVPEVLAPGHVPLDVADALRGHRTPATGVVGLHHDAPAQAAGVLGRLPRPEALLPPGGRVDEEEVRQQGEEHEPRGDVAHHRFHRATTLQASSMSAGGDTKRNIIAFILCNVSL